MSDVRTGVPTISTETHVLLGYLQHQRLRILEALDGLDVVDLRRQPHPLRWSCVGLVQHLSLDVERFWFQAVIAGDSAAVHDVINSSSNAWNVSAEQPVDAVLAEYRSNCDRSDAIVTGSSLDAAPAWWPEHLFGLFRLNSVREIVLHVITETAAHSGHVDVARELIDGTQHLVLTE